MKALGCKLSCYREKRVWTDLETYLRAKTVHSKKMKIFMMDLHNIDRLQPMITSFDLNK